VASEINRSVKKCSRHKRLNRGFEQKFKTHEVVTRPLGQKSKDQLGQKSEPTLRERKFARGWYFKVFRNERLVLSNLARSLPNLDTGRKNRRSLRAVYYRLLPLLSRLLTLDRDQKILRAVARDYATALRIVAYRNQSSGPSDRPLWSIFHITSQAETRYGKAAEAAWQKLY